MGLTSSSHKDVHVVQSVDDKTLLSVILTLLDKRKLPNKDPEYIAKTAMQFLQQSVEVKHKDMVISEILEEVRSNSEVLVWFEDIGQVSIKSGQGGHRIAILGNLVCYEIILFEHFMKTHEITGTLLNLLNHFMASKSVPFSNNFTSKHGKSVLSDVRNFVQLNSFDWKDASINFDGIFPLTLTSGNGSHRFDLHEILANSKTVATGNLEFMQQVHDEMKEKFENLKTEELLKTEAPSDKQPREAGNEKLRENKMIQTIKKLKTNLHEVDNEARIILKQHHEIKTMIDTEKKLQEQMQEEESNLARFERKLKDTKEQLSKTRQQNRDRINEWSKKMTEQYLKIEQEQNELLRLTKENEAPNHEDTNEEITLKKFDAREIGKLRIRYCGIEGAKKTNLQTSLEKKLIDLTNTYKKSEREKYWQNSTIEIFNEDDYYSVKIGTGKKRIRITSINGETQVDI